MPVNIFEYADLLPHYLDAQLKWQKTHIGIRQTLSLHSEHIYKDKFWGEMSIKVNYLFDIPIY